MNIRTTLVTSSSYKEISQRLSMLTTPLICDALHDVRLMDSAINPIGDNKKCIGRAYTVNSAQDSLSTMLALDDLQAFLAFLNCEDDDMVPIILMISACGSPLALAGGMCASVAKIKGYGGVVIDGPCRDVEEIKETNLPFFAKGQYAKSGTKDKIGSIREKIVCGGVQINSGEIIFADPDGIVVMSKDEAVFAINKGEEIQLKEGMALQKIREGARFDEICNIEEHIDNLRAGIPSKLRLTV